MRNLADAVPLVTLVASLIVIGLVAIAPAVWGLIDVTRTPEATWVGAGRSKARWIVVFALGLWAWFVGLIALVVYLRRVRPRLREAQTAAGLPFPPAVTPRLKRVVIGLTGGYVVLSALGLWAYATHPHEEPFDPALARQANPICASTQAEVGSPPSYPPGAAFEQRAQRVDQVADAYQRMEQRLRALSSPGVDERFDHWLATLQQFNILGHRYADAVRTGDPEIYRPAGNRADAPHAELNRIARANAMNDCVF